MRSFEIRRQPAENNRIDPTLVKQVILNDDIWMAIPRRRTDWSPQINPEDVPLPDYHFSAFSDLACRSMLNRLAFVSCFVSGLA